jgi:hypothetical protein
VRVVLELDFGGIYHVSREFFTRFYNYLFVGIPPFERLLATVQGDHGAIGGLYGDHFDGDFFGMPKRGGFTRWYFSRTLLGGSWRWLGKI